MNLDKKIQASSEMHAVNENVQRLKDIVLNFLIPLVCIVASLLVGFIYIYPAYQNKPKLEAEIASKVSLKTILSDKLTNLKNIIDFKDVIVEDSTLVNDVLPSEAKVPQLLTQVDMIAKEAGLKVTRLSYAYQGSTSTTTSVDTAAQTFVTVNMTVGGTYEQVQAFMSLLESSARFVQVDDFRYTMSDTTDSSQILDVTVNLSSPYQYVTSTPVTDEPVALDIKSKTFTDFITKLKGLRFYRIGVDQLIQVPEASESSATE